MNKLLEPIMIGNIELKNRIIFPPMTTGFEGKEGEITEKTINLYTTIAKGGASLIVLGDALVAFSISPVPLPAIYDDKYIPMLSELTKSVQAYGAKISPQLFHPEFDAEDVMKLSEDQIPAKIEEGLENFVNTLTLAKIEEIQNKFTDAARRAKAAGFDMIQVHGDRLIGQFSSPLLNKRTDDYGGNLENRARFALEIVRRIKEAIGSEMPIDYKFAIIRPNEGKAGPTLDEAKQLAKWLVEAGVDTFHVCIANHGAVHHCLPPMGTKPFGCFVELAETIKKVVNVPVATVGRIIDPMYAERLISDGKVDMVAIGRGLITDPEWPLKVKEGRYDDIRKCIMCNQGCVDRLVSGQCISCSINATVGRETTSRITTATKRRHVLIVGAGPSGMEAARVAALRGHQVTLIESSDKLGGQLNIASISPHKEEMKQITQYLISQIKKLGVEIQLGQEVTPPMIVEMKPDVVIIATGAIPLTPNVPGVQGKNVTTAWDVLSGKASVGQRVVVVGGGSVGCETAEFLAQSTKEVTLVEMLNKIGMDMSPTMIPYFMDRVEKYGIKVMTNHRVEEITENGITTVDKNQKKHTVECDTVVIAVGAKPNTKLTEELQGKGTVVYSVGDCAQDPPRKLIDAIHESYFTALNI